MEQRPEREQRRVAVGGFALVTIRIEFPAVQSIEDQERPFAGATFERRRDLDRQRLRVGVVERLTRGTIPIGQFGRRELAAMRCDEDQRDGPIAARDPRTHIERRDRTWARRREDVARLRRGAAG